MQYSVPRNLLGQDFATALKTTVRYPNFPEKKRIPNNGEHQKYIQEDHYPAIISRETFRAVQEMRESRSNIERHADGTVTRKA
ncbi:recombinase family protein [Enterococcus faecalis]|nr:recombinase family protein [Enterococcus faecalis]EKN1420795.1 recombinase family protein [Enterococcus faecalis]